MTGKNFGDEFAQPSSDLRKRAEEIFLKKEASFPEDKKSTSPEEIRKTFHELRVHQIELEMQNEHLQRAQFELDAARARYFDLYHLAPVGYLSLNGKGLIFEVNLTAVNLLGVTESSLVARPLSQFILPEDQDIYYRCRKQLVGAGEPQSCELRMMKSDGTFFWVQLVSIATEDSEGGIVWRITLSDITLRQRAEEALRERVKELQCLYGISSLIEKESSLEKIFQEVVELLPGAWLHANLACARIFMGEREYKSANFNPSACILAEDILREGKPVGAVEIFYSEAGSAREERPFLMEERKLLKAIAERLGRVVERIQTEEKLKNKVQDLEIFNKNAVGRELKMIELKEKLKALEEGKK